MEPITTQQVYLEVLQTPLYVVRFPTSALARMCNALCRTLVFGPGTARSNRFLSYTLDESDASLVVESVELELLRQGDENIQIAGGAWRAIRLTPGLGDGDMAWLIASFSTSLAASSISLLNITAFEADVVLVRERDLESAYESLKQFVLASASADGDEGAKLKRTKLPPDYSVRALQTRVCFASMAKATVPANLFALLSALVFRPEKAFDSGDEEKAKLPHPPFVSYIEVDDTISLLIDAAFANVLVHATLHPVLFAPLQLAGARPIGFDTFGVVASMTTPLARARIPLLNTSSYATNFTLVEEGDLEVAIRLLHDLDER